VARIAARQRTIVAAEQLAACGVGKRAVKHRIATGRLHVVFRGVYSVGCGELPPLAREQAALLACGEGAFLSHHSAAFFWGLRARAPAEVEVSVCGRSCASRKGLRVHRIGVIDRRELRFKNGLWLSSPARTMLEIAATASSDDLAYALDEGLARRLLTPREIEAVLARNRPCRGAGRLAALVGADGATAITRSRAEKAFLKLVREARLSRPEANVAFRAWEPDFMWRRERLIVELDSYGFHSGPGVFHRDREKDLVLRDAGFDVLRFTRAHVVHEPAMVLVRLAQALVRRTPRDQ
jgi:very-short-patch-repair endonuclease